MLWCVLQYVFGWLNLVVGSPKYLEIEPCTNHRIICRCDFSLVADFGAIIFWLSTRIQNVRPTPRNHKPWRHHLWACNRRIGTSKWWFHRALVLYPQAYVLLTLIGWKTASQSASGLWPSISPVMKHYYLCYCIFEFKPETLVGKLFTRRNKSDESHHIG